jgi:hypothetical protein
MRLPSARGVILEELVLHLLTLVGYRIVSPGEEGTQQGHSGLEVRGRGEWHQIDALAAFDRTPAFMYPLRLLLEAKCYARGRPVGIEVARNTVGVLKDISENYFTYTPLGSAGTAVQVPRFNYHAAIFSTSGYTSGAQRFAIAHQIFLIQYERVPLLEPVVVGLLSLAGQHILGLDGNEAEISARLRSDIRQMLKEGESAVQGADSALSPDGFAHVRKNVVVPLLTIEGSYFGMLQGRWPMHLLSRRPLPEAAFAGQDEVACRVYGRDSDRWSFAPVGLQEGDASWFRLEFDIPAEVVGFVRAARGDPLALAAVKQEHFSYLDLAGRIGGIQRHVRLRLDEDWLEAYLKRILGRQSLG